MKKDNTIIYGMIVLVIGLILYTQGFLDIGLFSTFGDSLTLKQMNSISSNFFDDYPVYIPGVIHGSFCASDLESPEGYIKDYLDFNYIRVGACKYPPSYSKQPSGLECAVINYGKERSGWRYIIQTCDYECFSYTDCGDDGYIGQPFCRGDDAVQLYKSYSCYNPRYSCSSEDLTRTIEKCTNGCFEGHCKGVIEPSCETNGEVAQFEGDYYICKENKWIGVAYLLSIDNAFINELQVTLEEKAQIIEEYSSEIDKQSELIETLEITLDEKILIIQTLTSEISKQAELISKLETTLQEKIDLVNQLGANIQEQTILIESLTNIKDEQAQIISGLELTISEQSSIIAGLEYNLQEKIALIKELQISNEQQQELIDQMEALFSEQEEKILELTGIIEEDAEYINSLQISIQEKAEFISSYKYTIEEQAELISKLELTLSETTTLINNLNLKIEDDAVIISTLELSLDNQAEVISGLGLTVQEQIELIDELKLSVIQEKGLVEKLQITVQEQEQIIKELKENPTFKIPYFWDKYKWIIIGLIILLAILVFVKRK